MKRFIAGFITCLILLSAIFMTGFAENALNVFLNTFPIYINGQQIEVEAYNINGRTFVSIGDVAKYFGATVVNNETEKKIEIKASLPKTLTSTKSKIEYDPITGLPIGAEYVEAEKDGIKYKLIKYNAEIYISIKDLNTIYEIENMFVDGFGICFYKDGIKLPIDSNDKSNHFFAGNHLYYRKSLFDNYLGE